MFLDIAVIRLSMQGIRRKIIYVFFYELFGITLTTIGLAPLLEQSVVAVLGMAIIASIIAVLWNFFYNTVFERWEARQPVKGRGFRRRVGHAVGFELGLTLILVPALAYLLKVSLLTALLLDIGLVVFFLFYTFFYTLAFDRLFGLPRSAVKS